jgi:hypothetical protein
MRKIKDIVIANNQSSIIFKPNIKIISFRPKLPKCPKIKTDATAISFRDRHSKQHNSY